MGRLAVVLVLGLAVAGCGITTDWGDQSGTAGLLRITGIEGSPGGEGDADSNLESDVAVWNDDHTGYTVFPDQARLTVALVRKNPELVDTAGLNDVRLERYEVRYTRTDGRNVAGADVPYPRQGPMSATVRFGGSTQVFVEVVTHAAKMEPPLSNLVDLGGEKIISCIAEITVHGRSGSGEGVRASGALEVVFADFGD